MRTRTKPPEPPPGSRLTPVRPAKHVPGRGVLWECRCACGNAVFATPCRVDSGSVKSCGCLRRDTASRFMRENRDRFAPLAAATRRKGRAVRRVVRLRLTPKEAKRFDRLAREAGMTADEYLRKVVESTGVL